MRKVRRLSDSTECSCTATSRAIPAIRAVRHWPRGRRRTGSRARGCAAPAAADRRPVPRPADPPDQPHRPPRARAAPSASPSARPGPALSRRPPAAPARLGEHLPARCRRAPAEQSHLSTHRGRSVDVHHVQQRDVAHKPARGVDTRLPRVVGEPDQNPHDCDIRRLSHSAATPTSRQAGTVGSPSRRNSPVTGGSPRRCRICRHSSVAS